MWRPQKKVKPTTCGISHKRARSLLYFERLYITFWSFFAWKWFWKLLYCHLFNKHCGFTVINIVLTLLKMKPMSQENQDSYISNCNTRRLYEINISKAFTLNRRELLHQHVMRCRWETLSFGDFIKWFVSRLPFSTLWVVFLPAAFFHCVLSLCMYFRAFIFIWLYDHPQSRKILKFCA